MKAPHLRIFAVVVIVGFLSLHPARLVGEDKASPAYNVDVAASRLYVKVDSATRLGHPHGVEGRVKSGTIGFDGKGQLVFDMNSFTADTADARKRAGLEGMKVSENEAKKVTDTMHSDDVLGVARFPTAVFRITAITPQDKQAAGQPGAYLLEGKFILHGTEKPLQFKAALEKTDQAGVLKMAGTFTIKQTDYGMTPYSTAAGLVRVADELQIWGDLVLQPMK